MGAVGEMRLPIESLVHAVARELFVSRRLVFAIFLGVNVVGMATAMVWPKSYTSSTTLFVEERNILDPLMQGAAVRAQVADRSRIAREVIFSRGVMYPLAEDVGLFREGDSDIRKEQIVGGLRGRTNITNMGRGLIRIEHSESDPEIAYRITKRMAELFILESHEKKYEESKAAYEFIDKQVQEYQAKLAKSEDELKNLRSASIESGGAGGGADVVTRLNQIRSRIDQTREELRDAEIKKGALQKQLAGESDPALVLTKAGQYRTRISELQAQLSRLRLTYQDSHPDIVRIRHEIDDLYEAIKKEETRRQSAPASRSDAASTAVDEGVVHNPVYQQLRRDLTQTEIQIDTLSARLAGLNRQLRQEQQRGKEVHGEESVITQLSRDTTVNTAIYQDLLRRRQNALVSLNMSKEREGLGFSIHEEAAVPLHPSGLSAKHVAALGFLMSLAIPIGLCFARVRLDGRVRIAAELTAQKVQILGIIPHMWSPAEVGEFNKELRWGVILIGVLGVLAVAMAILRKVVWA